MANEFVVITEDGDSVIICFHKEDFAHLFVVDSVFSDSNLGNHCIDVTFVVSNIKTNQHDDFGTIRKSDKN